MSSQKIMGEVASGVWLENHMISVMGFIRDKYHHDDYDNVVRTMFCNPVISRLAVLDKQDLNQNKLDKVFDYLSQGSLIVLVVGQRGSGKSCTVHFICRNLKEFYGRDIYYIGPPMNIDSDFKHAYSIYDTPEGSINVIDESALLANSRKSMSNSNISMVEILPTLRHVNKTIFVITQNTSMTDITFFKMADALIVKKFSMLQQRTERELFDVAFNLFVPLQKDEVFFFSESLLTLFTHQPHNDWTDELSRSYRFIKTEEEAQVYAKSLFSNNYDVKDIRNLLRVIGFNRENEYYENLLGVKIRKH